MKQDKKATKTDSGKPTASAALKEQKGKKGKRDNDVDAIPAPQKKGLPVIGLAVVLFLLIVLVGFLFLIKQFNVFALRDKFFDAMYKLNPSYVTVLQYENLLQARETQIVKRENELDAQTEALQKRQSELAVREAAVAQREADLKAMKGLPIYRRPLDDSELQDMQALAAKFAEMEPQEAANVLSKLYSLEDMAAILYYMDNEASAAIMAKMEPTVAAGVTDKLLYY